MGFQIKRIANRGIKKIYIWFFFFQFSHQSPTTYGFCSPEVFKELLPPAFLWLEWVLQLRYHRPLCPVETCAKGLEMNNYIKGAKFEWLNQSCEIVSLQKGPQSKKSWVTLFCTKLFWCSFNDKPLNFDNYVTII